MKILWSWLDLSETASNDLVYYAGIWVAYFLGARDPHHEISNHLIGLIEKGKKRVVVSYLLIMETVYAQKLKMFPLTGTARIRPRRRTRNDMPPACTTFRHERRREPVRSTSIAQLAQIRRGARRRP